MHCDTRIQSPHRYSLLQYLMGIGVLYCGQREGGGVRSAYFSTCNARYLVTRRPHTRWCACLLYTSPSPRDRG
eukprot:3407602-Rhodomonas_salina.1